jgi:hypothetical protein
VKGRKYGQDLVDTQCCFKERVCCYFISAHNDLLRVGIVCMGGEKACLHGSGTVRDFHVVLAIKAVLYSIRHVRLG